MRWLIWLVRILMRLVGIGKLPPPGRPGAVDVSGPLPHAGGVPTLLPGKRSDRGVSKD